MKVRFSVVEEFVAELEAEQNHVEDNIVRATYQYEQSTSVPLIYHMSVVAGFAVRGKLVYVKQACGDVWQGEQIDKGDKRKREGRTNCGADRSQSRSPQSLCAPRHI